ncbi:unnamed protein product [Pieris brassicae]|uniref:Uncharacterized protein n=1 Tax=Pieris brassicae TaxID=7116 RepID=A0A9P0XBF1_PIEBR|nr:unnamed protein product [Pieris brassicae]
MKRYNAVIAKRLRARSLFQEYLFSEVEKSPEIDFYNNIILTNIALFIQQLGTTVLRKIIKARPNDLPKKRPELDRDGTRCDE